MVDLKSTIVAGLIGALILGLWSAMQTTDCPACQQAEAGHPYLLGFGIGAGVQIGVRVLGVS